MSNTGALLLSLSCLLTSLLLSAPLLAVTKAIMSSEAF